MPPTDNSTPHSLQLDTSVSRREFARRAVAGAASAAVLPLHELAAGPWPRTVNPEREALAETQTPSNAPKLSPQSQAEADARFQSILNQYGDRFSDAQKTDLKRLCISAQPGLDRLRGYAVDNSDLPALYLKPFVDREKKPDREEKPAAGSLKPPTKPPAPSPKL
jgi:hypothetical protein